MGYYSNGKTVRELKDGGDYAIARKVGADWRITAEAGETIAEVKFDAYFNEAGFRGRQWEADGQQFPSLKAAMAYAIDKARSADRTRVVWGQLQGWHTRVVESPKRWAQAEKASEARHGARLMRSTGAMKLSDNNLIYWATQLAAGLHREDGFGDMHATMYDRVRLPEDAPGWPIYRAAITNGGF